MHKMLNALAGSVAAVFLMMAGSTAVMSEQSQSGIGQLSAILEAQPDDVKARYQYRHPQETLEFFGIERGMTVVEALPGRGWYTKILLPYLGQEGTLIGADYALDMYANFGFMTAERMEEKKTWVDSWTAEAASWHGESGAGVAAMVFGSMPEELSGTADAVLFIRALHNMNRFEPEGGYFTTALKDAYALLKPGGVVGIVQHQAPDALSDEWASGANGYLKKSHVIEQMEKAGFEFEGESDINANPKDQPGEADKVWRLPPSLRGHDENPEQMAAMREIGESNRMTLKFKKPS